MYLNYYDCPCGLSWQVEDDQTEPEDCPECDRETQPTECQVIDWE